MNRRSNGEGSILKRSDGRWAACYWTTTATGLRKRRWLYGKTKSDVTTRLRALLAEAARGIPVAERSWTVEAFLQHWLNDVVELKCTPSTVDDYRRVVSQRIVPRIGRQSLARLSVDAVQQMFNQLFKAGLSTNALHETRKVLRSALTQAQHEQAVQVNVAQLVHLPALRRAEPKPWSIDECQQFLRVARRHRYGAAFLLMVVYGLRRGEVLGLTWGSLDLEQGTLRINKQLMRVRGALELTATKTRNSDRYLPLIPIVTKVLIEQRPADSLPEDLVITSSVGTPVEPRNLGRVFQQLASEAGLRRIHLHDLRHTAATLFKDEQIPLVDAQRLLGHADALTTVRLYQHGNTKQQAGALTALSDRVYNRKAVEAAVKHNLNIKKSRLLTAFLSGGPAGTRTPDTLLKRLLLSPLGDSLTPVLSHLCTCTYAHLCGHLAVELAVKTPCPNRACVEEAVAHLYVLTELQEANDVASVDLAA